MLMFVRFAAATLALVMPAVAHAQNDGLQDEGVFAGDYLTPQLVARVRKALPRSTTVTLHSGLAHGDRVDRPGVLVGTRQVRDGVVGADLEPADAAGGGGGLGCGGVCHAAQRAPGNDPGRASSP